MQPKDSEANGIGGFALAAAWTGIVTTWTVEIDPFCNAVSRRHFPHVRQYLDIYHARNLPPVDIISAGYPCQPESYAGKRGGAADNRWLWPEVRRVVEECRPGWFLGENVSFAVLPGAGHVSLGLDGVLANLEAAGYEVEAVVLPACALNAPHRRDRVWIIAHTHDRLPARPPQALCPGWDAPGFGREAAADPNSQRRGQPDGQPRPNEPGQGSRPGRDSYPAVASRGTTDAPVWPLTQPALCARNIGQRELTGRRILNLTSPYQAFDDEHASYPYTGLLESTLTTALTEVEAALRGKGTEYRQLSLFNEELRMRNYPSCSISNRFSTLHSSFLIEK